MADSGHGTRSGPLRIVRPAEAIPAATSPEITRQHRLREGSVISCTKARAFGEARPAISAKDFNSYLARLLCSLAAAGCEEPVENGG